MSHTLHGVHAVWLQSLTHLARAQQMNTRFLKCHTIFMLRPRGLGAYRTPELHSTGARPAATMGSSSSKAQPAGGPAPGTFAVRVRCQPTTHSRTTTKAGSLCAVCDQWRVCRPLFLP